MQQPIRYVWMFTLLALLGLQTGAAEARVRHRPVVLRQHNDDHPGRGQGRGQGQRRRALNRQLGLSDRQRQQILQIQRQHANNPNKREMWRQIRGVLTPEQFQHLKAIRQGRGQGR